MFHVLRVLMLVAVFACGVGAQTPASSHAGGRDTNRSVRNQIAATSVVFRDHHI